VYRFFDHAGPIFIPRHAKLLVDYDKTFLHLKKLQLPKIKLGLMQESDSTLINPLLT
jgi:hypothetical protein